MLVLVIFGLVQKQHQLDLMRQQALLLLCLMNRESPSENKNKENIFVENLFTSNASICLKRKTIFALAN
jgi:hypothetical protein